MNNYKQEKYSRQTILEEIGSTGQSKIGESSVLVIGAGGLGCPCLQSLVAGGVGKIGIVDGDTVALSNLHRQILFSEKDLGQFKAEIAAKKVLELNPEVKVSHHNQFLDEVSANELIPEYDVIIDCSDNFECRYLINDYCIIHHKPFISGALYKYEGQVSVFNYANGPTYRCLFPDSKSLGFGCNNTGVLGATTAIIGNMMAMEVIKVILNHRAVLSGKLLIYHSLTNHQLITEFAKDEKQITIAKLRIKNINASE